MSTASVAYPRPRVRNRVDHASIALLRAVMADSWRPEKAARDLLTRVRGDRRVLRLMRAKLSRAMLERPTRITERAVLTLDHALAAPANRIAGPPALPRQGGRDA